MKTVKESTLEMIDIKNVNHEYIKEEKLLEKGIEQYLEDRSIEKNLEKYKDRPVLYSKMVKMKLKHFETCSFEMLMFYFVNYSIITELLMIKGQAELMSIEENTKHIPIDKDKAIQLYHAALQKVGECRLLEYEDKMIEQLLLEIRTKLKITE